MVYWRIPTYINWYRTQRHDRVWRVVLEGIAAGFIIAAPFALKGSGEPSITMQPLEYVGWFAIMCVMGVFNSATLYFINSLVIRRKDAVQQGPGHSRETR